MQMQPLQLPSSDQPTGTITVSYNVSETGNFITDGDQTINLDTSGTTTQITVATSDPTQGSADPDSTITVTLLEGENYTLADPEWTYCHSNCYG